MGGVSVLTGTYTYSSGGCRGSHYQYAASPTGKDSKSTRKVSHADKYTYVNGTLRNKLRIKDEAELAREETERLRSKIITTETVSSKKLDIELLKAIHRFLFDDLYTWAGKFRTVHIEKVERFFIPAKSLEYPEPEYIYEPLKKELYHLNSVRWADLSQDEIAKELANRFTRIWKIHPFRDGNTRAILGFLKIFAIEHNFPMDMSVFTQILSRPQLPNGRTGLSIRDMFVGAALKEQPEPQYLQNVFRTAIINGSKKDK